MNLVRIKVLALEKEWIKTGHLKWDLETMLECAYTLGAHEQRSNVDEATCSDINSFIFGKGKD